MKILGINSGLHDASACLVIDGQIVAFSAEERLTRLKHDGSFPIHAIRLCLKQASLDFSDIDAVAYGWDYFKFELEKLQFHIDKTLKIADESPAQAIAYLADLRRRKAELYGMFNQVDIETRKYFDCEFIKVEHHLAHAYSVFPLSGFETSAVLIVDGSGEKMTSSLWHHKSRSLRFLKSYNLPDSLGVFYAAITQFLGFIHHDEEWKVMGWAGYGQPRFYDLMKDIISVDTLKLNLDYFELQTGKFPWYSEKLSQALHLSPRNRENGFDPVYADVAASAQKVLEDCMLVLAREIRELTYERKLCLAGGVALNGKANGCILDHGIFESVFVQPASADDGIALGAALKVAHDKGDDIFHKMESVYFGSGFKDRDYIAALQANNLAFVQYSDRDLYRLVAQYIFRGRVGGWFQGRSEMGPRALGNRSILADPRDGKMKDILNSKVKFREAFRPFAPSVLEEHAEDYFEGNLSNALFMNQIFRVKQEAQSRIPAVTHVDETARIQIVTRKTNPKYYDLIRAFYELTGVAVLVNTSFNVKEEPIVDSPQEAIDCFLKTGIDFLVLGNCVSVKDGL